MRGAGTDTPTKRIGTFKKERARNHRMILIRKHLAATLATLTCAVPVYATPPANAPHAAADDRTTLIERLLHEAPAGTAENGCTIHVLQYHNELDEENPIDEDLNATYKDCAPIGTRDPADRLQIDGIISSDTESITLAVIDYGADGPGRYDTIVWSKVNTITGGIRMQSYTDGVDPHGFVPATLHEIVELMNRK